MSFALAVTLSILCCLTITLTFLVAYLYHALRDLQDDMDHTHDMAHTAITALALHLDGQPITLHHMKIRTTDKE